MTVAVCLILDIIRVGSYSFRNKKAPIINYTKS